MPGLPRKTRWQPAWKPLKRTDCVTSPIDTARPQENQRLETRHVGVWKTSISCEASSNFDTFDTLSNRLECHKVPRLPCKTTLQPAWKPLQRRGLAASPEDTARPQENQRLETRHVGASKRAFRARFPPIFTVENLRKGEVFAASAFRARRPPILTLCSLKIDVFLPVFLSATSKSMFRARLPSIFSTCHKMPRLLRKLHLVATWRSPANAICKKTRDTTRLKCCACHEKWRWTRPKCCACHEKLQRISWKTSQKYCACHTKRLSTRYKNTSECHEVPRLPRETKQRDVWNLQKWPLLQKLP